MKPLSKAWLARFATHGEPFDFATLGDPHDALYRDPLEVAGDLLGRRIAGTAGDLHGAQATAPYSAGFYTSGTFNAHAASDGEEALIAISAFVPPVVFTACAAVAVGLEGDTGDAIFQNGKLPVPDCRITWPVPRASPPDSPEAWVRTFSFQEDITSAQFDWAMRLYDVAMRYLIAHEGMHVLLGHTAWRGDRHAAWELTEFHAAMTGGPFPLRDVVEFQADYNAAVSVTRGLLNGPNVPHLRNLLGLPDDRTARLRLFKCIVRALVIMTHCFPQPYHADPFARHCSHPHPYLRARSVVVSALAAAQEVDETSFDYHELVLPTFLETVALLETRTTVPSWDTCLAIDAERMRQGHRHSEQLHDWRQKHARRVADYFYRWAPTYRLQDDTVWQPPTSRPATGAAASIRRRRHT